MKRYTLPENIDLGRVILWQYNNATRLQNIVSMLEALVNKASLSLWTKSTEAFNLDTEMPSEDDADFTMRMHGLYALANLFDIQVPANLELKPDVLRRYIKGKIWLMDSDASVTDINKWLSITFPDVPGIQVQDNLDMTIQYRVPSNMEEDYPDDYTLFSIEGFLPHPAGVKIGNLLDEKERIFGYSTKPYDIEDESDESDDQGFLRGAFDTSHFTGEDSPDVALSFSLGERLLQSGIAYDVFFTSATQREVDASHEIPWIYNGYSTTFNLAQNSPLYRASSYTQFVLDPTAEDAFIHDFIIDENNNKYWFICVMALASSKGWDAPTGYYAKGDTITVSEHEFSILYVPLYGIESKVLLDWGEDISDISDASDESDTGPTVWVKASLGNPMPPIVVPPARTEEFLAFNGYVRKIDEDTSVEYYNSEGQSVRAWDLESGATLMAKWRPFSYVIRTEKEDGSRISEVTAEYGSWTEIPAPSIPGYTFNGWIATGYDKTTAKYSLDQGTTPVSMDADEPMNIPVDANGRVSFLNLTPMDRYTVNLTAVLIPDDTSDDSSTI